MPRNFNIILRERLARDKPPHDMASPSATAKCKER
jgi:hypothetical protein